MADIVARGMAVITALLLIVAVGILFVTSRPGAGSQQVKAEFDNAFPLIEGMHVRVDGAIAGSVGEIEVNDRGNAVINLVLNDSVEPVAADATAAVRQQDTTGDSYVALEPGASEQPVGDDGIVCEDHDTCPRTLISPRLDDLLNAFGPGERAGIKLTLVETAKALDRRGADLNAAALALKPGLAAANEALAEVSSQNEALKRLVESAADVTGQAASRKQELEGLIDSLAGTLTATAEEGEALDAGLERLPETSDAALKTLSALDDATREAIPIAEQLEAGAPEFASAIERLAPFVDDASAWIDGNGPTLELTRKLVTAAEPSLTVSKKRVITGAFDLTGATADLLNATLGGEDAFPALFGDDSYGEGEGTLGKRGFGAVAVEPGDLPGYPAEHAPRNWLRVSAVINCEVFGRPVERGCLADALADLGVGAGKSSAKGDARKRKQAREPARERGSASINAYAGPSDGSPSLLPGIELPRVGEFDPNRILPDLGLPGLGESDPGPERRRSPVGQTLGEILDFLFKP